jgi:hypothetical protein
MGHVLEVLVDRSFGEFMNAAIAVSGEKRITSRYFAKAQSAETARASSGKTAVFRPKTASI